MSNLNLGFTVEDTIRSYAGRPGCMCGCLGTYNETPRARKMAITSLLKNPEVRLQTWNRFGDSEDAGCIFVTTETRNRVLYLNEKGVEKLRGLVEEIQG